MKFLDYLFHGKELKAIGNYFKMLNGYSPTFTSFSGGVYEMDLTRTAINNFATHCSKLKPEIEGSALKSLEKTLQHKPNYFMDTTKFIKRLATYVAVEHTAFIIPIEDEYGRLCGWYPLRAERCEVVESEGQLYLRYLFANGSYGAIEFERVGIMTDFEYKDDLFGEDNSTLAPTMQLIHTQNEGIINAVKNSANIRFLAKVANMLKPEDIKKERKRFTEDNLSAVTIVKETPAKIWNSIVGAVTRVATWGTNMLTKAKEVMNTMVTGIVTIVKEIPEKIYNSISGAISKVATWGTEVKNKAVEGMKNVITGITDVFKDIGSTFAGFGKNMVEGIWNGIHGATQWIKDKISGWVGNVTDFLKGLFGINSPSKLMRDEIGVYLAQGIGVGFSDEIGGVKKMIEDSVPQEFDVGAKVNVGKELTDDYDDKKPKPRGGGSAAGGVVVNQYIYANTTDYAKQQKEAARQFRMIARTV